MLGYIGPVATWLAWKKFFDKINTTAEFPKSIILDLKHEKKIIRFPFTCDIFSLFTPSIAEILCAKNGRAIVVCGFLMN